MNNKFEENYNGVLSYIYKLQDDRDKQWALNYLKNMRKLFYDKETDKHS